MDMVDYYIKQGQACVGLVYRKNKLERQGLLMRIVANIVAKGVICVCTFYFIAQPTPFGLTKGTIHVITSSNFFCRNCTGWTQFYVAF